MGAVISHLFIYAVARWGGSDATTKQFGLGFNFPNKVTLFVADFSFANFPRFSSSPFPMYYGDSALI